MKENNENKVVEIKEKKTLKDRVNAFKETKAGKIVIGAGKVVVGALAMTGGILLGMALVNAAKNSDEDSTENTIETTDYKVLDEVSDDIPEVNE